MHGRYNFFFSFLFLLFFFFSFFLFFFFLFFFFFFFLFFFFFFFLFFYNYSRFARYRFARVINLRDLDDASILLLLKAIMYSSFKVDSSSPINQPKAIMNEDVKFSSASPFMIHIMTEVVLANINRFSVIVDTYVDCLLKVSEMLSDQLVLVKCYLLSVFKVSQELVEEVGLGFK